MAWTDPPTFNAGDILTASQLNQYVTANTNYLKAQADGTTASAVQVIRGSAQSIGDGITSYTEVSWTSEGYDLGSWWSSGTDITVPSGAIATGFTSALATVKLRLKWATDATGLRRARVMLDGGVVSGGQMTVGGISGDGTELIHTIDFLIEAGQVITIEVSQSSGGNLDLDYAICSVTRLHQAA